MSLPQSGRVLVAGCGDLGAAAGGLLQAAGHQVFGVRRNVSRLPPELRASGVALDLLVPEPVASDWAALPERLDAVIWAVAPGRGVDAYQAAYVDGPKRLLEFLVARGDRLVRAVLVSSTSVWGHGDGEWVDETTPVDPAQPTGEAIVEGERAFASVDVSTVALRLGGIYGPGRTRLIDGVRSRAMAPPPLTVTRYTNRIHRDDAATAIVAALELDAVADCYVVVDDDPADRREVLAWLAEQLGVELPAPELRDISHAKTQRGRGNKRCRNTRLRGTGWAPRFPDFRSGYRPLLDSMHRS